MHTTSTLPLLLLLPALGACATGTDPAGFISAGTSDDAAGTSGSSGDGTDGAGSSGSAGSDSSTGTGGSGSGSDASSGSSGAPPPPAVCGDAVVAGDEACDDGNLLDADGCEADCTLPACGNGIQDPGEHCFDEIVELQLDGPAAHAALAELNGAPGLEVLFAVPTPAQVDMFVFGGGEVTLSSVVATVSPFAVDAADIDSDGWKDLVFLGATGGLYPELHGALNAGGTLGVPAKLRAGRNARGFAVRDLDSDGIVDVVMSEDVTVGIMGGITFEPGFGLYKGDGDGKFWFEDSVLLPEAATTFALGSTAVPGAWDTIFTSVNPGRLRRWASAGAFELQDEGFAPLANDPVGSAFADLDGDGVQDAALLVEGSQQVMIMLVMDDGDVAMSASIQLPAVARAIHALELDGDGVVDLAVALADGTIQLMLGVGGGLFTTEAELVLEEIAAGIASGDVNADGLPDLVTWHASSVARAYLSTP
jgi:cysteine-rich repeat protein